MTRNVAKRQKRVLRKVETMWKIASCLPAPSYALLLEKLRECERGVASKKTISERLRELQELGAVKKTSCHYCGHEIYELMPLQHLVMKKDDGTEEERTLDLNHYTDFVLFVFGRKKWECERRSRGKKRENVTKEFTITIK